MTLVNMHALERMFDLRNVEGKIIIPAHRSSQYIEL